MQYKYHSTERGENMKRVVISSILLCLVLLWSFAGGRLLCRTADSLIADIDRIENLYDSGNKSEALELSEKFSAKWKKSEKILALMVHEEKIGSLEFSAAKITPLIETDNDELPAELQNIRHQLERIKHSEKRI